MTRRRIPFLTRVRCSHHGHFWTITDTTITSTEPHTTIIDFGCVRCGVTKRNTYYSPIPSADPPPYTP